LFGLLAISTAGCRAFPTREITSLPNEHFLQADVFRISSSSPIPEADPLARELVELRATVQATLHLTGPIRPIDIYVFDNRARYERFIETNYPNLPRRRAFFMAKDHRAVVYAFKDDKLIEDLRHEACHALLHSAAGAVPLWLDEGLAEYFESPAETGGLHPRHVGALQESLRQGWRPSLTRLESLTQLPQMSARDYREAWAWVYWLIHDVPGGRQILVDYLTDLSSTRSRGPLSDRVFAASPRPDVALVSLISQLECPIITTSASASSQQP
jgi:hypothetical protein